MLRKQTGSLFPLEASWSSGFFHEFPVFEGRAQHESSEVKSLWLGDLGPDVTEAEVRSMLPMKFRYRVKLMSDRVTGKGCGYCFLDFERQEEAADILREYGGRPIPGKGKTLALRWGSGGRPPSDAAPRPRMPQDTSSSVFVGDLDYSVTEAMLIEAFRRRYETVLSAKIVTDTGTGQSKGFGFIRFGDASERDRAIVEMHGMFLGDRQIRVTHAASREERGLAPVVAERPPHFSGYDPHRAFGATAEGENACVFVGGLDESVTPDMLRHHFGLLGDIQYIRIPPGRGCGFVGFVHRKNAEAAISTLQGLRINGYKVRLSWGSMRGGVKTAAAKNQNTAVAVAKINAANGRPGLVPQQVLTHFKKEHKTPLGAITQDYLDHLPEPPEPWGLLLPTGEDKRALVPAEHKQHKPVGPLVSEPSPGPQLDPELPFDDDSDDDDLLKTPGVNHHETTSAYVAQLRARYAAYNHSHTHKKTTTKKKAFDPDFENAKYANRQLKRHAGEAAVNGVEIPMPPPPFLADPTFSGAIADTPMALYT